MEQVKTAEVLQVDKTATHPLLAVYSGAKQYLLQERRMGCS